MEASNLNDNSANQPDREAASNPNSSTHPTAPLNPVSPESESPNMPKREQDNGDVEQSAGVLKDSATKWKPSRAEVLIMGTLALISLMVSLDATVIVTSLSVRTSLP